MIFSSRLPKRAYFAVAVMLLLGASACSNSSRLGDMDARGDAPEEQTTGPEGQVEQGFLEAEAPDLNDYVGSYEGRAITLMSSTLFYRNEGMPSPAALNQIGEDHFEVIIPPGARVRGTIDGEFPTFLFTRGSSGEVETLSIVNPDESVQATFQKTE